VRKTFDGVVRGGSRVNAVNIGPLQHLVSAIDRANRRVCASVPDGDFWERPAKIRRFAHEITPLGGGDGGIVDGRAKKGEDESHAGRRRELREISYQGTG
jgi:hypothetical protein